MTFCKDFQKYGSGIICGSGLGPIADQIDDPICLDYNEIPHLQKIGLDFLGFYFLDYGLFSAWTEENPY